MPSQNSDVVASVIYGIEMDISSGNACVGIHAVPAIQAKQDLLAHEPGSFEVWEIQAWPSNTAKSRFFFSNGVS